MSVDIVIILCCLLVLQYFCVSVIFYFMCSMFIFTLKGIRSALPSRFRQNLDDEVEIISLIKKFSFIWPYGLWVVLFKLKK